MVLDGHVNCGGCCHTSVTTQDAYTLCEVLRACVSGAQWQRSLKFLDLLGQPERHPDTRCFDAD